MGEMERLKEFGFKGSKEEYDKAGGDLFSMKDARGKTLQGMYKGGAEKLAGTAKGKLSTVSGNIKSGMADAGTKILEKLGPALSGLIPISEKIGSALPGAMDVVINAFSQAGTVLGPLFSAIQGAISPLIPHFITIGSIIGSVLSTALQALGTIITGAVVPAVTAFGGFLQSASSVVMGVLTPTLNSVAGIIKGIVIPAFTFLVSGGINIAKNAFNLLKGAVDAVKNAFNRVKGAVESAIKGLSGIGGMIKGKISGMLEKVGVGNNAGGTQHFRGGLTTMNEMGGEALQLPKGTKIYPASTTKKMINEKIGGGGNQQNVTKNITLSPVININGANKTNNEVGKDVMRELKRLAVTV